MLVFGKKHKREAGSAHIVAQHAVATRCTQGANEGSCAKEKHILRAISRPSDLELKTRSVPKKEKKAQNSGTNTVEASTRGMTKGGEVFPAQGNVDMLLLQAAQVAGAALFIVYIHVYKRHFLTRDTIYIIYE